MIRPGMMKAAKAIKVIYTWKSNQGEIYLKKAIKVKYTWKSNQGEIYLKKQSRWNIPEKAIKVKCDWKSNQGEVCLKKQSRWSVPEKAISSKHKFGAGYWVLVSCQVSLNFNQGLKRRRRNYLSQSEAGRTCLFFDQPEKNTYRLGREH